ncbi:MAG: Gfo/Idh/MocA family oxidoreductase, partial [Candidatus Eisenbacteria bacterium]|nr:Gfo/Idh/MocA family oxidoreductase [Candidatus Eisenbacteria bacterium]
MLKWPGRNPAAPIMTIESGSDAESQPRAARTPVRVAVAGLGRSGLAHAATLATLESAELVGLCDPSAAARRNAAGMGFRSPIHAQLERLIAREKPEAIWVCAAIDRRAALATRALAAGAAVLIERPIALAFGEGSNVVDEARRAGRALMVSHPLVHQPVFARAQQALASGAIGRVRQARASTFVSRVFSPRSARRITLGSEAGVTAHAAFDLLFLLTRMLGQPAEVRATANRLYGDHEDELHAMVRFTDGAEAGFDCSWSVPGYPRAANVIELGGERGRMLVSDDAVEIDVREGVAPGAGRDDARGASDAHTRWGDADLPQPARFDLDGEGRWIEDAAFVHWLRGGPAPPGAGAEAL